jgi:osmotically-inducible protein OsmY
MMTQLGFLSAIGGSADCRDRRCAPRRAILFFLLLILASPLGACSTPGLVLGAGASGAVAAAEERGIGGSLTDSRIKAMINFNLLEEDRILFKGLSTAVYEGRVLLTGIARSVEKRDAAVRVAWQTSGVKEVINEIVVDPSGNSGTFVSDTWIATRLRTKLMFDRDIESINYTIDTLRGTVHVLGVAQHQDEMEKVLAHARNLSSVRKVVNHVILKTDPRRQSNQAMK